MATKAQVKAIVEAGMVAAGFRARSGTDIFDMPHLHNDALIDGLYDSVESRHYKSIYDPTDGLPESPALGDTYIAQYTANGWTQDYIYEWTGDAWDETVPWEGCFVWIDDRNAFYYYDGADWAEFTGDITITGAATTIVSENLTAERVVISDSSGKIAVSAITATELGYLDNVTGNIQTQLNGKQTVITGAATTIVSENLTTDRVVISDSSGKIAVSAITATELGYLDNVTGNIQTQLNGKIGGSLTDNYVLRASGAGTAENSIIYDNGTNIGIGTSLPSAPLECVGVPIEAYEGRLVALFGDNTAYDAGVGGGIGFNGKFNSAGDYVTFAAIKGVKTNDTNNNRQGELHFQTNTGESAGITTPLETAVKILSNGALNLPKLTASRVAIIGSANNVESSSVTTTTLGYLDATSSIQTQLNGKVTSEGNQNYIALFKESTGKVLQNSLLYQYADFGIGLGTGAVAPLTRFEIKNETAACGLTLTGENNITAVGQEYAFLQFRSVDISPLSVDNIVGKISAVAEYSNGAYSGMAFSTTDNDSSPYLKERVRITHLGRVGIGIDTPEELLHIEGAHAPRMIITDSTTGDLSRITIGVSNGNGGFATFKDDEGNENVIIRSYGVSHFNGGDVGVATTEPLGRLDVSFGGITIVGGANSGTTSRSANTDGYFRMGAVHYNKSEEPASVFLMHNQSDDNDLRIGGGSSLMNAAMNITFWTAANTTTTAGTERMRIKPNGNIYMYNLITGGASDLNIAPDGQLIRVVSSGRYKENVRSPDVDPAIILKFKPTQFRWADDERVAPASRGKDDYGFIAEQIAAVMPEMVNYNEDGTVQSWKTQKMLVLAVAELQRQNQRIDALVEQINKLKGVSNGKSKL